MTKPSPPTIAWLCPTQGHPEQPLTGRWGRRPLPSPRWGIWQLATSWHRAVRCHVWVWQWLVKILHHRRLYADLECTRDVSRTAWHRLSSSPSHAPKMPCRHSANRRCRRKAHRQVIWCKQTSLLQFAGAMLRPLYDKRLQTTTTTNNNGNKRQQQQTTTTNNNDDEQQQWQTTMTTNNNNDNVDEKETWGGSNPTISISHDERRRWTETAMSNENEHQLKMTTSNNQWQDLGRGKHKNATISISPLVMSWIFLAFQSFYVERKQRHQTTTTKYKTWEGRAI